MKNLILGGIVGFAAAKLLTKKSTPTQAATSERMLMQQTVIPAANSGGCRTCQRADGSYYMAVKGGCREFDVCVSHNR